MYFVGSFDKKQQHNPCIVIIWWFF